MARLTKHQSFSGLKTTFLRNFDGRECVRVCVRTTTRYLIFSMIIKFFLFSLTRRVELRAWNWQWICCLFLLNVLCLSLKAHWTSHPKKTRDTKQKTRNIFDIFFAVLCRNLCENMLWVWGTSIPSFIPYVCLRRNMRKNRTSEVTESCQRINDFPRPQNKRVKCLSGNRKRPRGGRRDAERLKKY